MNGSTPEIVAVGCQIIRFSHPRKNPAGYATNQKCRTESRDQAESTGERIPATPLHPKEPRSMTREGVSSSQSSPLGSWQQPNHMPGQQEHRDVEERAGPAFFELNLTSEGILLALLRGWDGASESHAAPRDQGSETSVPNDVAL
eukprot:CAMPEP_0194517318 /NCGR_PEP_ID=MMETSP0253-20130528/50453_1 /TAXON_ID=2966 /ORGANISM="Noctiluca scintillans" /LENGTH=144 /DNA_ID=CAMNT_0039361263 /DNA_START=30 /DNA_END=461 /DNA_ORIENTATION=-